MKIWRNIIILLVVPITVFWGSLHGLAGEEQKVVAEKPLTVRELPEFRITKGEVLYNRYCSFCHGETGAGDGLNAYSIPVKPRNLNDRAVMAQKSDDDLEKVIGLGGSQQGLSRYMPAFDKTLSIRQIKHLVSFIRKKQENNNK